MRRADGLLTGSERRPAVPGPDEVHVWPVRLDAGEAAHREASRLLSGDELLRAGRFRFEHDRRRFAVCRAALRTILGGYLGVAPSALHLQVEASGKPRLDPDRHEANLSFNVSHAGERALVAVAAGPAVGVDIEPVQPRVGLDDIVARNFAPAERQALSRAAPAEWLSLFYRFWTLKEAYLKACGVGMSGALDEIDVSGGSDDHPVVLPDVFGAGRGRPWTGLVLSTSAGYAAALVVQGPTGVRVRTMTMPGEPGP
jgi:4'-phosphopantetheinyl transferase